MNLLPMIVALAVLLTFLPQIRTVRAEENDEWQGATDVAPDGTELTCQLHSLTDMDWYKTTISGPGTLSWTVHSLLGGPGITFVVFHDQGQTSGAPFTSRTISPGSSDSVDLEVSAGGTYYMAVSGNSILGNGYYQVSAEWEENLPPLPNPSRWLQEPFPLSATSIQMSCDPAFDIGRGDHDPCKYSFVYQTGSGGHSSGWVTTNVYVDTGLEPNTRYGYIVKAKDRVGNETTPAPERSCCTWAAVPPGPLVSNPTCTTLDVLPQRGENPWATELALYDRTRACYIRQDGSPNGSTPEWVEAQHWTTPTPVNGLAPGATCEFSVKARNRDDIETVLRASASGTTLSSCSCSSRVIAWGYNNYGQTNVPMALTDVVGIASGSASWHSLALRSDGTATGWGLKQPSIPSGLSNVVAMAAGWYHDLYLLADGSLVTTNGDSSLAIPSGLDGVAGIACGGGHSLAFKSDGTVVAWGLGSSHSGGGQHGQAIVPEGLGSVVAVAAGEYHSLALKSDGTVVAWGYNQSGATDVPVGLSDVVAIAGGARHSLALRRNGTVVGWGANDMGQTSVPSNLSNVVAIAAGGFFNLALHADGGVSAWGDNDYGQTSVPSNLGNVVAIAAGSFHAVALVSSCPLPPLPLSPVAKLGEEFRLSLPTTRGAAYFLESAESLDDPRWSVLGTTWGDGTIRTLTDPNATAPKRFYRIRRQ